MSNNSIVSIIDLNELIVNKVAEGKSLDYKITLPGNSDEDKKEFLYDVASFANTIGGHLIYGIDEVQGFASNLVGVETTDVEATILRFEEIIRNNISPRITFSINHVLVQNNNYVFIIHIPQSLFSPHMVTYKGVSRFYARNSAGKYQLDVQEIRQAFLLSESILEKIKKFKLERISKILSSETPIPTGENAKVVIHCAPLSSFGMNQPINLELAVQKYHIFFEESQYYISRYNLDGVLMYLELGEEKPLNEYLQVFRNSEMELLNSYIVNTNLRGERTQTIPITDFEIEVIKKCNSILNYQKALGIEPPFYIFISLLNVKNLKLDVPIELHVRASYQNRGIDRDNIFLPEIMVNSFPEAIEETSKILKPVFDTLWNSAGWGRSMNYNEAGERISRR